MKPIASIPAAPAAKLSKESYIKTLADRASKGDTTSLAILTDPKTQVTGFAELLQTAGRKPGKTLAHVLANEVEPETLDWLLKSLPKDSPQTTAIKAALLQSRASLPISIEFHPIGSTTVGFGSNKLPNDRALITVKGYDDSGKSISEKKGVKFWSLILRLANDPAALEQLRAAVSQGT